MSQVMWNLSADRVLSSLKEGKRLDGRKLDEYRPIKFTTKVSENAEGACRLQLGKTDVVAGVKFITGEPYPDSPDEGTISVGAELLALAAPDFESGPPREKAIELSRVVDRGIRESKCVDFKSLCIKPGELVWIAFVDLYILNFDGNLFDACALASLIALQNARLPKLDSDNKIIKGEFGGKFKLARQPVMCTFVKVGNTIVVDPSLAEEMSMDARFSVTTTEDDYICAFQKGGLGSFMPDEINKCVSLAFKKGKELREYCK